MNLPCILISSKVLDNNKVYGGSYVKNYHTHTYRCKHATGEVIDYAKIAVEQGITVLGMTDHTPLPDNRWLGIRMEIEELPEYLNAIKEAEVAFPNLKILKGMECEYATEYHNFYQDELLGRWKLDYLILGPHFFPYQGEWLASHHHIRCAKTLQAYTDHLITSMESGLFTFVAHPDLFGITYEEWDQNTEACSRQILLAAADLKIPLEINGYGFRKPHLQTKSGSRPSYPWLPFWELAQEYDVEVVVNSDAHQPQDVAANIVDGLQLAKQLNLKIAELVF